MNLLPHNMKFFTTTFFVLAFAFAAMAQPPMEDESRREKIERLKRAYISEKLDLNVQEAEKFWPIYNEFAKKREGIRKSLSKAHKYLRDQEPPEKETLQTVDEIAAKRKEEIELENQFAHDVMPVLGVVKTRRLLSLEEDFRKAMMQKLKERRGGRSNDGPGGFGPPDGRP